MSILIIPERFNKNAPEVRAMATQSQTGVWLIEYMCKRLGVPDLGFLDVLDFGCGCRFADAIVNHNLPIASYTGIDLDREMIEFLSKNISDGRLRFHHWDAANPVYNPTGFPLTAETPLPADRQTFSLICMFSVITHQTPSDAESLFRIFRKYISRQGRMFFSATIDEMHSGYRELVPEQPTAHSAYSINCLTSLLERTGWQVISIEPKNPSGLPIQDSILCAPAS